MLIPITKTIDGFTIITGLTELIADPEATKAASILPLAQIPEAQQLHAKVKEKEGFLKTAGAAGKHAMEADRQAKAESEKPIYDKENPQHLAMKSDEFQNAGVLKACQNNYNRYEQERKDRLGSARLCNSDLITLSAVVQEKHKDIKRSNPIYTNPGVGKLIDRGVKICGWIEETTGPEGEIVPGSHAVMEESELGDVLVPVGQTVESLIQAWMAKGENQAVQTGGEIVADYRGKLYHFQTAGVWGKRTIVALGEFPGETEISDTDLTDTQRQEISTQQETERIGALSAEAKQAEIDAAIDSAAGVAAVMKTKLEIQGATAASALTQSKVVYNAEVDAINLKYGV